MLTVSDTSPISNLAYVGRLNLLQELYHDIRIPEVVKRELARIAIPSVRDDVERAMRDGWLRVQQAKNTALVQLLSGELDAGEAEAIALALELKADHLLLDEREGRVAARHLDLTVTGVLGVLLRAKAHGSLRAIKPEIDALRAKAHFFIAPALEADVLRRAGEEP